MMEDGKKKIWICLLAVVLAAVVIGLVYYLSMPSEQAGEGFLIEDTTEHGHEPGLAHQDAVVNNAGTDWEGRYGI